MSSKNNFGPRRPASKPKNKKSASRLYTPEDLRSLYGLSPSVIERYFPEPFTRKYSRGGNGGSSPAWTSSQVTRALEHPKIRLAMDRVKQKQLQAAEQEEKIRQFLLGFDVEKLRQEAETLARRFVLHVGPTNSGKTYQALQALKQARTGVYLGPLRLLALEMYETMNRDGVPCSLLTGEESVPCPGALHTASTIELADFGTRYDVAVIDEAQMIADPFRGDKWFRALYCLRADEIHVCLAPEARDLIIRMLENFGAPYTVMEHKRLAPLSYTGVFENLKDVQPGDALIVFSRKAVLAVSAELERAGKHASVIYGALPPVSRREEVRRFSEHETEVVVATDAIGMGISLPIRRVIFCETSKFDGKDRRPLRVGEIRQIAGRAGRFGIYDRGEVLTMTDPERVRDAMLRDEPRKNRLTLPFPEEALDSEYPLDRLMIEWNRLPKTEGFTRVDMSDAILLYSYIKPYAKKIDRKLLFRLITCPVDVKDESMILYWLKCCLRMTANQPLPEPVSGIGTLEECESRYKELDIRHQLLRQIGIEENRMDEKLELCDLINRFLKERKDEYLRRCRQCGRILPPTHPYGLCERCHAINPFVRTR